MLRRALAASFLWAAAGLGAAAPALLDFTAEERARILTHGPWPPRAASDAGNVSQNRPDAAAFGQLLFTDRRLSVDGRASCASCHVPALAFQDGQSLPRLRDALAAGVRNTPSLLDSAQRRWLGWDGAHDSLWSASLAPLLSEVEMGHTVASLAALVRGAPDLERAYVRAMGQLPAADEALAVGLARALAAYQSRLLSPRVAFDDFRDALQAGDNAAAVRYPLAAQRGLRLFVGEARCSVCHAGPSFTTGEFADIGRPFFVPDGVDGGRHAGLKRLLASPYTRLGQFSDAVVAGTSDPRAVATKHVVVEHRHFGEFRVPGLRGLVQTAPYMHDGSLPTLQDIVQHYSELNEDRLHADGERILRPLNLSPGEAADLVAFLRSLSPVSASE